VPFPGGEQRTATADPGSSADPLSHVAVPPFVTIRPGAGAEPPSWPTATQGSNVFTTVACGPVGVIGVVGPVGVVGVVASAVKPMEDGSQEVSSSRDSWTGIVHGPASRLFFPSGSDDEESALPGSGFAGVLDLPESLLEFFSGPISMPRV
jgi:hypothetical protein